MVKKALILSAGLGTRLGEQTKNTPKALVEINGIPMLEFTIERLKQRGISQFMVNVHHHGQQIIDFIKSKNNFNVQLEISDERQLLLDTGGAIRKASSFFKGDNPVLVHNVDVISEVDIPDLAEYHLENKSLVTLCIRKRSSGRALLFDHDFFLKGWANLEKQEYKWVGEELEHYQTYAYNGIYLANPEFPDRLPFGGKFSIIDAWLNLAKTEKIIGYHDTSPTWFDLGTKEKIETAESHLPETDQTNCSEDTSEKNQT